MDQMRQRGRLRTRVAAPLFGGMFLLGGLLGCQSPGPGQTAAGSASGGSVVTISAPTVGNADDFLVVDCVLPAQVRRLGRQLTYLGARRAIRTSAIDCEIRGGEYVAYDRANYATALQVWLEAAQLGDPEAQNYVGEIYERGLGRAPDYALAAEWYRRAAEQGFAPAQINLGQLYEQGLGVPKDQVVAINWYRQASGFEEAGLTFVVSSDVAGELQELRDVVLLRESDAERLREQIKSLEAQIARLETARRSAEGRAAQAESVARVPGSEAALEEIERARAGLRADREALEQERRRALEAAQELQRLEAALEDQRRLLAAKEAEVQEQRAQGADESRAAAEAEQLLAELRAQQIEVERRAEALAGRDAQLAQREQEVARRQAELAALEARIEQRESVLAEREQTIQTKEGELSELDQQLAELRKTFEEQSRQLAELSREQEISLSGPEIRLIDPEMPVNVTRGTPVVWTRADVRSRPIIGMVDAPAGLLSLLVNDHPLTPADNKMFQYEVPIDSDGTKVSIVAVDRQGKRSAVEFMMAPETQVAALADGVAQPTPEPALVTLPDVDLGNYHALVIGNNAYQHMPKLDTAIADAEAVADLLAKQYGFQVQVLRDANRYQILSALNELRARLTEDDNLLIYYAGHGELDQVNMRGHWLPVDAERNNDANWISNVSITDILNTMSAKHIMVVADSCYSGALTRTVLAQLEPGMSLSQRMAWIKATARKRSRTALTSGGLAPVLDGGGGGHSVFARAFLEALENNPGLIEGQRLFQEVSARVTYAADQFRFEQLPQYAPIKHTGHEAGDFLFLPRPDPARLASR